MECLENIIGLTQNDCACIDGDKPADFATLNGSDSGLYITDEGDGFPLLDGVFDSLDCGRSDNVFTSLATAREKAISSFLTDYAAFRAMSVKPTEGFNGLIGRLKNSSAQTAPGTFAGQLISPPAIRGRSLVITSIYLGLSTDETTTVTIASDNPDFTEQTIDVTNVAGKFGKATFATPVSLDFTDGFEYAIYYEVDGKRHLQNDYRCCGTTPKWRRFFNAQGFTSSDVDEMLSDRCCHNACGKPYGLVIDAYLSCDDQSWMCTPEQYGLAGFTAIIAKTIQFKAAANIIQFILDGRDINEYSLLRREALYGKRNARLASYETNVKYLAQQAPTGGCIGCKKSIVNTRRASLV